MIQVKVDGRMEQDIVWPVSNCEDVSISAQMGAVSFIFYVFVLVEQLSSVQRTKLFSIISFMWIEIVYKNNITNPASTFYLDHQTKQYFALRPSNLVLCPAHSRYGRNPNFHLASSER